MKKINIKILSIFISLFVEFGIFGNFTTSTANAAYGPSNFYITKTVNSLYGASYPNWLMNYFKYSDQSFTSHSRTFDLTPYEISLASNITHTEFEEPLNNKSFSDFGSINNIGGCNNVSELFSVIGSYDPRGSLTIYNNNFGIPTTLMIYLDQIYSGNIGIGQSYNVGQHISKTVSIVAQNVGAPNPYTVCTYTAWDLTSDHLGISSPWASPTIDMQPVGTWNQGQTEELNVKVFTDKETTVNLSSELCFPAPIFSSSSFTVPANQWPDERNIYVTIPLGNTGTCRIVANGTYNGQIYPQQTQIVTVNP